MPLFHHLLRGGLHHEIGAVQVHLERAFHHVDRHVEEGVKGADARIADHHVDLAEGVHGPGDEILCGLGIGDVALHRDGALADRLDLRHAAGGGTVAMGIVDGDVGAMPGSADGGGAADAGRCAGDEDGLAFEQLHGSFLAISAARGGGEIWRRGSSPDRR